jgi:regulator of CtrA degradation
MNDQPGIFASPASAAISFREKFALSPQFKALFEEGMSLVERTAAYLDGLGRREAKALKAPASVVYATESMRLTTRLMQLASWLLLRRAVTQGEISEEQARHHRRRVRLVMQSKNPAGFEQLPDALKILIEDSHRLYDRVLRLDRLIDENAPRPVAGISPVGSQISRLKLAFPVA